MPFFRSQFRWLASRISRSFTGFLTSVSAMIAYTAILGLFSACTNSTGPVSHLISVLPETVQSEMLPGGDLTKVSLSLTIDNRERDAIEASTCTFQLYRDAGPSTGLVRISSAACNETLGGQRIAAQSVGIIRLSQTVETRVIRDGDAYRASIVISRGPEFRSGIAYFSESFFLPPTGSR